MLKITNHSKNVFVQETSLLSATHGGPIIKAYNIFVITI